MVSTSRLQWGHVVVDVEGLRRVIGTDSTVPTLQWGHVVVDVEGRRLGNVSDAVDERFNGATSSSTWKDVGVSPTTTKNEGFNGATSSSTWKGG